MKRQGFTLIELLAVIVILAIIALIAVPLILNIVEKAKKGAFEDSAYGIINSARMTYVKNLESPNLGLLSLIILKGLNIPQLKVFN